MRYILFFLIIGLLSCNENNVTLPNSTGSKSEILFVSPDYLWENKLGEIVINFFTSPIPVGYSIRIYMILVDKRWGKLGSFL